MWKVHMQKHLQCGFHCADFHNNFFWTFPVPILTKINDKFMKYGQNFIYAIHCVGLHKTHSCSTTFCKEFL
jgi:hypothetical protein